MFSGFSGVMGTVSQYPLISLSFFLVLFVAAVAVFSRKNASKSFGALARVFWSIVSTPFEFLRDALSIIRGASASEEDYCTSSDVLRQLGFGFSGEMASSGVDI